MGNPQVNQEVIRRVNMLLDNELTKDAERALLNEIKTNPTYRALFQKERAFREFIKSKIHRRKVSPSLISSIKSSING